MSDEIHALIAAGEVPRAWAQLRAVIAWPMGRAVTDWPPWLALVRAVANARGTTELDEPLDAVIRDPESPDHLYALGYALIDHGAPEIAASILWRCLALVGDSEEVVSELVSALESSFAYPDALAILEERAALRERSYFLRYLYGFNAAMAGQLAITRVVLPTLVEDTPEAQATRRTLAGIVERAERWEPRGVDDLRGWTYVLGGTLLLHQSPYGYPDPMHGRYAYLRDHVRLLAFGLDRLAQIVAPLALPCIYAPPGHVNAVVAHALAARTGLPIAAWPSVGVPAPGLVVAYDLSLLEPAHVQQLQHRREQQIVFAHAQCWTADALVAPDVATLHYQHLTPVFGDAGEVASDAAAVVGSLDAEELAADEPALWAELVAATWPPPPGPRARAWAGGPVPANRFT